MMRLKDGNNRTTSNQSKRMRSSTLFYLLLSFTQLILFILFAITPEYIDQSLLRGLYSPTIYDLLQVASLLNLFLVFFAFFMTTVNDHRARNSFHLALALMFLVASCFYFWKSWIHRFGFSGYILSGYHVIFFLIFCVLWIKKEAPFGVKQD